jgi:hypothetical protein
VPLAAHRRVSSESVALSLKAYLTSLAFPVNRLRLIHCDTLYGVGLRCPRLLLRSISPIDQFRGCSFQGRDTTSALFRSSTERRRRVSRALSFRIDIFMLPGFDGEAYPPDFNATLKVPLHGCCSCLWKSVGCGQTRFGMPSSRRLR